MNFFDAAFKYRPLMVCTHPSILHAVWSIGIATRLLLSSVADEDRIVYMLLESLMSRNNGLTSFISILTFRLMFSSFRILSSAIRACRPFDGRAAGYSVRSVRFTF